MNHTIECPSGLVIGMRQILVGDQRILSDRRLVKTGESIDALLSACGSSVVDPGIYRFTDRVRWPEVLQGDRLFALIRLRAITHGEAYEFRCGCPSCKTRFDYTFNLDALPIKRLPESSKEILRGDGVFSASVAGAKIRFKLINGADERRLQSLLRGTTTDKLSASLSMRIVDIDGVEGRDKKAWLEEQGLGVLTSLLAAFEEVDCGVETEIEIECPSCGEAFEINLPFGGDFLMPKKKATQQTI